MRTQLSVTSSGVRALLRRMVAQTLGLIARVVPHDELRAAALEAAHQVLRSVDPTGRSGR